MYCESMNVFDHPKAPNRYLSSVFTARLTTEIDENSRLFRNTFLNIEELGEAECRGNQPRTCESKWSPWSDCSK